MATDGFHERLMGSLGERMDKQGPKRKAMPVLGKSTQPAGAGVEAQAIRQGAIATSHNTFRPDIYRVSEGYLN